MRKKPNPLKSNVIEIAMEFKGKVIVLLVSALATVICWQMQVVSSSKLLAIFVICFFVLLTAGDLLFSQEKRNKFKQTYQKIDQNNPDREHRPKPKVLIWLSVVGIIGSILLGIPVLPYVFSGLLLVFLFHAMMIR